jgi:hypothetical protein
MINQPFSAKEFEDGKEAARNGTPLPADASDSQRQGHDSEARRLGMTSPTWGTRATANQAAPRVIGTTTTAPAPAPTAGPKVLVNHKTAIGAQTNRPERTNPVGTPEPPNPNENVTITVVDPGKVYEVTGIGSGSKINFYDCTVEAVLAIVLDRLEKGPAGVGEPANKFDKNAVADVRRGLEWLQQGTRDRLEKATAWPVVGFSGTAG